MINLVKKLGLIKCLIILFYSLPILTLLKIISPFILIRFDKIISNRIGHIAENYHLYILKKNNNYLKPSQIYFDIFFYNDSLANTFIIKLLNKKIIILSNFLILPIWDLMNIISKKTNIFQKHYAYIKTNKKDGYQFYDPKIQPFVRLSKNENKIGEDFLNYLGISSESKFVCLNIHDNQYLKETFPDQNWDHHNGRVSDINNYKLSINKLIENNFFVIRMGKKTKIKLDIQSKFFYDYSFSKAKKDILDIFLISKCTFYFSNNTGLDHVAILFNKPILKSYHSFLHTEIENEKNILFFKYHYDYINKKYLRYNEVMAREDISCSIYKSKWFEEQNIQIIENDENEIADYVDEMILNLNNQYLLDEKSAKLQNEFWNEYIRFQLKRGSNYYNFKRIKAKISNKYLLNELKKIN